MRLIFIAIAITGILNYASAQTSSTISLPKVKSSTSSSKAQDPFKNVKSGWAAEGVRVSIFKPTYDMSIDINIPNVVVNAPDIDSGNGLFVGYAYLPVRSFGFIGGANYIEMVSNDSSANTLRLEANGAWAFTQNLYAKIGLNNTRFVSKGAGNIDAGMGHQMGLGFQLTKNLGLDLTYSEVNMSLTENMGPGFNLDADVKIRGTEIGLTGTF